MTFASNKIGCLCQTVESVIAAKTADERIYFLLSFCFESDRTTHDFLSRQDLAKINLSSFPARRFVYEGYKAFEYRTGGVQEDYVLPPCFVAERQRTAIKEGNLDAVEIGVCSTIVALKEKKLDCGRWINTNLTLKEFCSTFGTLCPQP
jgi:hypothetical protein